MEVAANEELVTHVLFNDHTDAHVLYHAKVQVSPDQIEITKSTTMLLAARLPVSKRLVHMGADGVLHIAWGTSNSTTVHQSVRYMQKDLMEAHHPGPTQRAVRHDTANS